MPVDENDYNETTNYKLPYPVQNAPIDTAQDFENLAVEVDNQLKATNDEIETKQDSGDYATSQELTDGLATKQNSGNYLTYQGNHWIKLANDTRIEGSGTTGQFLQGAGNVNNKPSWQNKNWVPSSGGTFTGVVYYMEGANARFWGVDGTQAYNNNSSTTWSNPYLLTVMTAIQRFAPASSKDVKHNIKPLSTDPKKRGIDEVVTDAFDKITPVSFKYTQDERLLPAERGRERFGFISEDVHDAGIATDEWTFDIDTGEKDDDGYPIMKDSEPLRLLKETDLIAVLWAKVQELETRLKDLEP